MVPVKMEIDVLVLGGGSAGLCNAMAAREAGASVILIYKAGGNSTAVAAGGYAVVLKDSVGDSVEQFIADAERSGAGLEEPDLLHRLAEGAIPAIERAAGWGVEFYRTEDGQYRRFRSGGHTFPRSLRFRTRKRYVWRFVSPGKGLWHNHAQGYPDNRAAALRGTGCRCGRYG